MVKRGYTAIQGLVSYWATQTLSLYRDIDDEGHTELVQNIHDAMLTMERDRRIVVVGGAGSGKSSLLSSILDTMLPTRVEMTTPFIRWRYNCLDGCREYSKFLPLHHLDGLEVIDTADCGVESNALAIESLLPGADVLIAALDGRNLEDAACWPLLSKAEQHVGTMILAITFTDTLSAEATLKLKDKIRALCRERLEGSHIALLVCPNSETSLEAFAERIQEALDSPRGVRADIRATVRACIELLFKLGSVLTTRNAVIRTDSGFLQGIEREIDNFLSHQKVGLTERLQQYVQTAENILPKLKRKLRRTMGFFLSPVTLMRLEHFGSGVEQYCYNTLCNELLLLQKESDERFVTSCEAHWKSVRPRMKTTLECEIGDFPAEALQDELRQLRNNLGRELYAPFKLRSVRHKLNKIFTSRVYWMQSCICFICTFLLIGGLFGFFRQNALGVACVSLSLLIWGIASVAHCVAVKHICEEMEKESADFSRILFSTLSESLNDLIISRVSAYRRLYTKPRQKVASYESMLGPMMDRQRTISRQLHALEPKN